MKNKAIAFSIGLVVLFVGLLVWKNLQPNSLQGKPQKKIAATIFPIYDIAREIAGDTFETVLVLPPGASPHTYDPTPGDISKLQGAQVLFTIGHSLDNWSSILSESGGISNQIPVDRNITLREYEVHKEEEHHEEGETEEEHHEHEGLDPHYWLSVSNAILIADQIRDDLSLLYPESADEFARNHSAYVQQLKTLHEELKQIHNSGTIKNIATFHNGWAYFAQEYELKVVTTFEEYAGQEPTPNYLREFSEHIIEHDIKVIFSEPQFSPEKVKPIAEDLGVTLSEIDPIGGGEGRDSYIKLMRYNGDTVRKALAL